MQALAENPKFVSVHKLLDILAYSSSVQPFSDFYTSNKQFFADNKLSYDKLLTRMHTLSLCSLGQGKKLLTYKVRFFVVLSFFFSLPNVATQRAGCVRMQDVSSALNLASDDEVEAAVLDAVVSGRLEAKMDQLAGTISIERASFRSFTKENWKQLQTKLAQWRSAVSNVLQVPICCGFPVRLWWSVAYFSSACHRPFCSLFTGWAMTWLLLPPPELLMMAQMRSTRTDLLCVIKAYSRNHLGTTFSEPPCAWPFKES
jgi:hypothetical protein